MKIDLNNSLSCGDLLLRAKGPATHIGVYWLGQVIHIRPSHGLQLTDIATFSNGMPVRAVRSNNVDHPSVAQRFLELSQQASSYDLFSNNCEQVAYYLLTGRRVSPQLQAFFVAGAFGALIGSGGGIKGLAVGSAIAGFVGLALHQASQARGPAYPHNFSDNTVAIGM